MEATTAKSSKADVFIMNQERPSLGGFLIHTEIGGEKATVGSSDVIMLPRIVVVALAWIILLSMLASSAIAVHGGDASRRQDAE